MKKAYISFAVAAAWWILLLLNRGDFAIGVFCPKAINPTVMMRLVTALFYAILFGWIAPLAFGLWVILRKRMN